MLKYFFGDSNLCHPVSSGKRGKIYERCELALELKYRHEVAEDQVATWVCIAEHESRYNTSAVGNSNSDGSRDHGIFQISDQYWCSPPGKGWACGVSCSELEDDDIEDDFICAKRIYKEHKLLSGNGFSAWAVYELFCKGEQVGKYVKDCFGNALEDLHRTSVRPPGKKSTKKVYPWLLPTTVRSSTLRDRSSSNPTSSPARCSTSIKTEPSTRRATRKLDSATNIPGNNPSGAETAAADSNLPDGEYLGRTWNRRSGGSAPAEGGSISGSQTTPSFGWTTPSARGAPRQS